MMSKFSKPNDNWNDVLYVPVCWLAASNAVTNFPLTVLKYYSFYPSIPIQRKKRVYGFQKKIFFKYQ